MDRKPRRAYLVEFPLARVLAPLMARVRALAADTENIFLSEHALDQMWDRDIADGEVFRVLRLGEIDGRPWAESDGHTACKVVLKHAGGRKIGVVTILMDEEREYLFVKTVEWEDVR